MSDPPFGRTNMSWLRSVNVDIVYAVAKTTVLHPFVGWIVVLSLRALMYPTTSWEWRIAVAYSSLLTVLAVLSHVNTWLAYGSPREVWSAPPSEREDDDSDRSGEWKEELVLITGGSNGLGKLLAMNYNLTGTTVAILDTEEPTDIEDCPNITFYRCDVGDRHAVAQVGNKIVAELGIPTILINNAGIMHGKPLLELSYTEIERSIKTNLLSNFYTLKEFLPRMISNGGGTIVTVSSVIGHLGAAGLSDYAATKAGLLTLHTSLNAELSNDPSPGARNIRTILCTPGQLNTRMFQLVTTPSPFLAPIVEPTELAKEIIKTVNSGMSGEISLPLYAKWAPGILGILPVGIRRVVRDWSGIDKAIPAARQRLLQQQQQQQQQSRVSQNRDQVLATQSDSLTALGVKEEAGLKKNV